MSDVTFFVVVGLIGIGIGFCLGLLAANLGYSRSKSRSRGYASTSQPKREEIFPAPAIPMEQHTGLQDAELVPSPSSQKRMSMNPIDVFARALQAEVSPSQPFARSIAEQIDEILQEMLENSPLRTRAIRLMELPNKGMVVMVGLNQYEGIDAVPDEDVKHLLRSAVAEWERRVTEVTSDKA